MEENKTWEPTEWFAYRGSDRAFQANTQEEEAFNLAWAKAAAQVEEEVQKQLRELCKRRRFSFEKPAVKAVSE